MKTIKLCSLALILSYCDSAEPSLSYVADIDGNVYSIVKIGSQFWMEEDLKTTKYNDGNSIPKVVEDSDWYELASPGYCWYENDQETYIPIYGAIYNWHAISTSKICPKGWRVPSDADWNILATHLDTDSDLDYLSGEQSTIAGGKMKSTGNIEDQTGYWLSPNTDATNESGFNAVPAGVRDVTGRFINLNVSAYWWSATSYNDEYAWFRSVDYSNGSLYRQYNSKKFGFPCRCVKDVSIQN